MPTVSCSSQGDRPHPGERHQRVFPSVQGEDVQSHRDRGEEIRQHPEGGGGGCRLLLPVQPNLQLRNCHARCSLHHRQRRWGPWRSVPLSFPAWKTDQRAAEIMDCIDRDQGVHWFVYKLTPQGFHLKFSTSNGSLLQISSRVVGIFSLCLFLIFLCWKNNTKESIDKKELKTVQNGTSTTVAIHLLLFLYINDLFLDCLWGSYICYIFIV